MLSGPCSAPLLGLGAFSGPVPLDTRSRLRTAPADAGPECHGHRAHLGGQQWSSLGTRATAAHAPLWPLLLSQPRLSLRSCVLSKTPTGPHGPEGFPEETRCCVGRGFLGVLSGYTSHPVGPSVPPPAPTSLDTTVTLCIWEDNPWKDGAIHYFYQRFRDCVPRTSSHCVKAGTFLEGAQTLPPLPPASRDGKSPNLGGPLGGGIGAYRTASGLREGSSPEQRDTDVPCGHQSLR